jgi:hypothetical protein
MMKIEENNFIISIKNDGEKLRALKIALDCLPSFVVDDLRNRLAIFTMTHRRGIRLSRPLCENYEIIFLSEEVFPRSGGFVHEDGFRYFIFIVLHEVAHAYFKHKCPLFDKITPEEINKNEAEATTKAIEWFNMHISRAGITDQKPMVDDEIKLLDLNN